MAAFEILPFDSGLFNHTVARLDPGAITGEAFAGALLELKSQHIPLSYAFVPWNDRDRRNRLEAAGALLVDKKVCFAQELSGSWGMPGSVEPWGEDGSMAELEALALASGVYSRFKVDPRVPARVFTELYLAWIGRSVSREIADAILVERYSEGYAGMVTVRIQDDESSIGLIAVKDQCRGKGVGRRLVDAALAFGSQRNLRRMEVVTQGANEPACRLYEACGFQVVLEQAVYHLWL